MPIFQWLSLLSIICFLPLQLQADKTDQSIKLCQTTEMAPAITKRDLEVQSLVATEPTLIFLGNLKIHSPKDFFSKTCKIDWKQIQGHSGACKFFLPLFPSSFLSYEFGVQGAKISGLFLKSLQAKSPVMLFEQLQKEQMDVSLLPLPYLTFWLFGVAAPDLTVENASYNGFGYLEKLTQKYNGNLWDIHFEYVVTPIGPHPLPQKIFFTHREKGTEFTLTVSQFDVSKKIYDQFFSLHGIKRHAADS